MHPSYVVAVAVLAVVLGGCGTAPAPVAAVDDLTEHPPLTCPAALPIAQDPGDHGFGVEAAAVDTPSLPAPETAWVCQYDAVDAGQSSTGTTTDWRLTGAPAPVEAGRLTALDSALAQLAPFPPGEDRACPADLGPRWLVAFSHGRDVTGVVVEGYGCGDVRLTDEPFTAPAGETTGSGTVEGVLPAPVSLQRAIQAVVGDARFHRLDALDAVLTLPCDAANRATTALDGSGPSRSSPEEAARPYADGDHLVLATGTGTDGAASVNVVGPDGTLRRVVATTMRDDGWRPDSLAECS